MVEKSKRIIVWDKPAYNSLQKAYQYIREDSLTNAIKVRDDIIKIARSLPDHPEKFPLDKFKKNNSGEHRAFEIYSYRVAYKITENEIIILRVRHVKQEPKEYS